MTAGELEAADGAMAEAAALCRRLQSAALTLPAAEVPAVRAQLERCGRLLGGLVSELNEASARDDNRRRGLASYQLTLDHAPPDRQPPGR